MAILRLTSANHEFLKRRLRQDYPGVGSAHRMEAFASSCGYRTYAGQLAVMQGETVPVVPIDGVSWSARLAELGYGSISDEPLAACLRSQQLPDPCWVEFPGRDRSTAERWYYRCRKESLPYVTIEKARKYTTLEWDCITIDSAHDEQVREDASGSIVKQLFATFQHRSAGSGAKPHFFGKSFVGSIKGLRPDVAQTLADEFFIALYRASRSPARAAA